jgi:hypothetical protein
MTVATSVPDPDSSYRTSSSVNLTDFFGGSAGICNSNIILIHLGVVLIHLGVILFRPFRSSFSIVLSVRPSLLICRYPLSFFCYSFTPSVSLSRIDFLFHRSDWIYLLSSIKSIAHIDPIDHIEFVSYTPDYLFFFLS